MQLYVLSELTPSNAVRPVLQMQDKICSESSAPGQRGCMLERILQAVAASYAERTRLVTPPGAARSIFPPRPQARES